MTRLNHAQQGLLYRTILVVLLVAWLTVIYGSMRADSAPVRCAGPLKVIDASQPGQPGTFSAIAMSVKNPEGADPRKITAAIMELNEDIPPYAIASTKKTSRVLVYTVCYKG